MKCRCGARVHEPAHCTNGHPQSLVDPVERLAQFLGDRIDYEQLADLVAARLRAFVSDMAAQAAGPGRLVDAGTVARLTGMSRRWVYDHAGELGAVKAGNGDRPRLRFDPDLVRARMSSDAHGSQNRVVPGVVT